MSFFLVVTLITVEKGKRLPFSHLGHFGVVIKEGSLGNPFASPVADSIDRSETIGR